ncbi:MAG: fumarate reductase flavoprotein subunit, partial [Pseudomonadota bacterium]
ERLGLTDFALPPDVLADGLDLAVSLGELDGELDGDGAGGMDDERDAAHGLVAQRNFGGTKKWRTCFVADGTGHAMLGAVADQTIADDIPVQERVEALALIHDGGQCFGAIARNLVTGELTAYLAKATALATGGAGRLYRVSTNAVICEGMGHALALETGAAELGNMEAVQFHPTGIVPAGILVTEGCRGDGGLLLDVDGHRFMPDYEPEKKELASRDVVSRRMEEHIARGKGVPGRFGPHLWLDISLLGEQHIQHNLREVMEICRYFLGIDPTRERIPVRPAQHYTMGGVRTRPSGEVVGMRGLFAAGEVACWDLHGFNRLGGNSVAETVVAGMLVGEYLADYCDGVSGDLPLALARDFHNRADAELKELLRGKRPDRESASTLRRAMQDLMTERVGIFRRGPDLQSAVDELHSLLERSSQLAVGGHRDGANPELVDACRTRRMIKVALTIASGALAREESRGAHYREDFPRRDDAAWLRRTLVRWPVGSSAPTLRYEDLDIGAMELPPGWRGYGKRDEIPNPQTAVRQREIEALCAQRPSMDRHERQSALMPFTQLLPDRYRGRNERIDEPLQG